MVRDELYDRACLGRPQSTVLGFLCTRTLIVALVPPTFIAYSSSRVGSRKGTIIVCKTGSGGRGGDSIIHNVQENFIEGQLH